MAKVKLYVNVFEALEDDPAVVQSLTIRSELMRAIRTEVERLGLTQAQAARRMAVSQPRVSDLARGKIDRFTVDALMGMLARLGRQVDVKVRAAA